MTCWRASRRRSKETWKMLSWTWVSKHGLPHVPPPTLTNPGHQLSVNCARAEIISGHPINSSVLGRCGSFTWFGWFYNLHTINLRCEELPRKNKMTSKWALLGKLTYHLGCLQLSGSLDLKWQWSWVQRIPSFPLVFPTLQPIPLTLGYLVCALRPGPHPHWWGEEQLTPFLLSTVQCIQNKPLYFADRLYDSMKVRAVQLRGPCFHPRLFFSRDSN